MPTEAMTTAKSAVPVPLRRVMSQARIPRVNITSRYCSEAA